MRPARPPRRAVNLVFGCTASPAKRHKPHRFPAQLCEQDFDAYEEAVISNESMNRVASLLDTDRASSPRPDPRR